MRVVSQASACVGRHAEVIGRRCDRDCSNCTRVGTCDRRLIPLPKGCFLLPEREPAFNLESLPLPIPIQHPVFERRYTMFKRVKIRSYEYGLYLREGEFKSALAPGRY